MRELFPRAVLIKGGHLPGDTVIDLLLLASGEKYWMRAPCIHSANTHGTGCTLSSAIVAGLALEQALLEAVEMARTCVPHCWRVPKLKPAQAAGR